MAGGSAGGRIVLGCVLCLSVSLLLLLVLTVGRHRIYRPSDGAVGTKLHYDVAANGGETILLEEKASGWNVSGWQVAQQLHNGDYDHEIRFYKVNCSWLSVRTTKKSFASNPIPSFRRELVGLVAPEYMLPRSQLNYTFCVRSQSRGHSSFQRTRGTPFQADLYVFDNVNAYLSYLRQRLPLPPTAYHQRLVVSSQLTCYTIQFTTNSTSHYSIGVAVDSSLVYQFNYSLLFFHYNASRYRPNCRVLGSSTCHINMSLTDRNTCLLSYVVPYPPTLVVPGSTHIQVVTTTRSPLFFHHLPYCCLLLLMVCALSALSIAAVSYHCLLSIEKKHERQPKTESKSTLLT